MARQFLFEQEAREALKRGVIKIRDAVVPTFGPLGWRVVIDKSWGAPTITKDGVTVCEELELKDPYENIAVQLIKEAASKTNDEAGDGSTTTAILAATMFLEGIKIIVAGANPISVARGIHKAAEAVAQEIKNISEQITAKDRKIIIAIARIASNGDEEASKMLADVFERIGKDAVVSIEEGKTIQTELRVVEGYHFDRGMLSPFFVTDPQNVECVLEKPYLLIHEDKISSSKKLLPIVESVVNAKGSLFVIAEEVEGDALALLVTNKVQGILNCCAVKCPAYGDRRRAMLEDIAILTGGTAFLKDLGVDLETVRLKQLGTAKKIIVDADNTIIIEGGGDKNKIQKRIEALRREHSLSDSDYDREKLEERISKLSKGIAQINIGAATETEMKEKKTLFESALHSVKSALEEGIVPGGGVIFIRARNALEEMKLSGDEQYGVEIVKRALEAPLKQLAASAEVDPSIAVKKVTEKSGWFGLEILKKEFCDLKKAGIIDSAKVARYAILNAASTAGLLLSSDALVTELPEDKQKMMGKYRPPR